jgi:hypothetical protein
MWLGTKLYSTRNKCVFFFISSFSLPRGKILITFSMNYLTVHSYTPVFTESFFVLDDFFFFYYTCSFFVQKYKASLVSISYTLLSVLVPFPLNPKLYFFSSFFLFLFYSSFRIKLYSIPSEYKKVKFIFHIFADTNFHVTLQTVFSFFAVAHKLKSWMRAPSTVTKKKNA